MGLKKTVDAFTINASWHFRFYIRACDWYIGILSNWWAAMRYGALDEKQYFDDKSIYSRGKDPFV